MFWGCRCQGCITRLLACLPPIKGEQEHTVTVVLTPWRDLLTLTLCETSRGAFLSFKSPKNSCHATFSQVETVEGWPGLQSRPKLQRKRFFDGGNVSGRRWCTDGWESRLLLYQHKLPWPFEIPGRFPDVWRDARIFPGRGNTKNCVNGPSGCFRPISCIQGLFLGWDKPGLNYCNLCQGCEIKDPN